MKKQGIPWGNPSTRIIKMRLVHATINCTNVSSTNMTANTCLSWEQLKARIRELFSSENVNVDEVKEAMAAYHSDSKDWEKIATFDPHRSA